MNLSDVVTNAFLLMERSTVYGPARDRIVITSITWDMENTLPRMDILGRCTITNTCTTLMAIIIINTMNTEEKESTKQHVSVEMTKELTVE